MSDIIGDLYNLRSILVDLWDIEERRQEEQRGCCDITNQIEWLEAYIEQLKNSPSLLACPRCDGTGTYSITVTEGPEAGNGFEERCAPCGGTGRVTIQDWNRWRDYIYSLQSPEVKAAMDAEREAAVKAQREKLFTCPRCDGTGTFSLTTILRNGFNDDCVACRGTGRVTAQDWNAWCDYFERMISSPAQPTQRVAAHLACEP